MLRADDINDLIVRIAIGPWNYPQPEVEYFASHHCLPALPDEFPRLVRLGHQLIGQEIAVWIDFPYDF
jgi:hypothetical protein